MEASKHADEDEGPLPGAVPQKDDQGETPEAVAVPTGPKFTRFLAKVTARGFFAGCEEGSADYTARFAKVVQKFHERFGGKGAAAAAAAASAAPAPAVKYQKVPVAPDAVATIYGAINGPTGYLGRPVPERFAGDGFDGRQTSAGHKAADAEAFMAGPGGVAALLADLRERVVLQRPRDVVRFLLRGLGAPLGDDARAGVTFACDELEDTATQRRLATVLSAGVFKGGDLWLEFFSPKEVARVVSAFETAETEFDEKVAAGFVKDYVTRAMLDEVIQAEADDTNADGVISSEEAAAAAKKLAASLASRRSEFQTSAVRLIRAALKGGVTVHALDDEDGMAHALPALTRTLGSAFRAKVQFFGDQCSGAPEGCNARWARRILGHGRVGKAPQVVVASAVHGMLLNDTFHALNVDLDFGKHGFDGFRAVKARAKARTRAMQVSLDTAKDPPVAFDEATKITELRKWCKARGLSHKGKKPEIVARLDEAVQAEHNASIAGEKKATKDKLMKLFL